MEGITVQQTHPSFKRIVNVAPGVIMGENMLSVDNSALILEDISPQPKSLSVDLPCTQSPDVDQFADIPPMHVATVNAPIQPGGGVRIPGRGWKKRARAVCQAFGRGVAECTEPGNRQILQGGSMTSAGRSKRKAGVEFSEATGAFQIGTALPVGNQKKARSHIEITGSKESEAGVATADIQPCRSL
ncbi:hypothetical protein SLA2020_335020 [Shorea laevis]